MQLSYYLKSFMIEILSRLIRHHFYIVHFERYKSDSDCVIVDRFVGKHSLLKPELIVVNDQPYGFRSKKEDLRSLEDYPISIELEYFEEDGSFLFQSLDLCCDMKLPFIKKLTDVIYVANLYSKTISVERVKQLTDSMEESLVITSKLAETLLDVSYSDEDGDVLALNDEELSSTIGTYMYQFGMFIKIMDDLLVKNKMITQIDQIFEAI